MKDTKNSCVPVAMRRCVYDAIQLNPHPQDLFFNVKQVQVPVLELVWPAHLNPESGHRVSEDSHHPRPDLSHGDQRDGRWR